MSNYFSLSHITTGFIAVMVGFTSSAAIVYQAAVTAGASPAEIGSWILALGIGVAITGAGLSLYHRMPILTAWSTPGAALLVAVLPGVTLSQAIGVFIFSASLTLIAGMSGLFERLMIYIPRSLSSAMLAGVLLHFCTNLFVLMQNQVLLVLGMLVFYLLGKRFFPRLGFFLVLIGGVVIACGEGLLQPFHFPVTVAHLIFVKPEFSLPLLVSIGIPFFIVTMTSQMIPGLAVLNNAGYKPPVSSVVTFTGLANLIAAPFGAFSINIAAMTGAICVNEQAEADPEKRYKVALWAAFFYVLMGIFGATLITLLTALPNELVMAIAGIALISALGVNLKTAMEEEKYREPALITFLISASGINLFGVSSSFWGLLVGIVAVFLLGSPKPVTIIQVSIEAEGQVD